MLALSWPDSARSPAPPARARAREIAVEWREISTLIPYARNARTHSEAQVAQIAGSIREFGFTNPVLISTSAIGAAINCLARAMLALQLELASIVAYAMKPLR